MSKPKSQFDEIGLWSEIKLAIIKEYAHAYSTIVKKKGFKHSYVDGFAGAGVHISKRTKEWVSGSPMNALLVEPPFHHHYLVDLDGGRIKGLAEMIGPQKNVTLLEGNCNDVLLEHVFPRIQYSRYERALCLLDPYGLQLNWQVLQAAGQSKAMDIFLNFPIMDINRRALWGDPDKVPKEYLEPMTSFWGDDSWRDVAYQPSEQEDLFGAAKIKKVANDVVVEAFRKRLKEVAGFKYVPKPIPMRNNTNAVVYYLFFASQAAVAKDIIESIFRKYSNHSPAAKGSPS